MADKKIKFIVSTDSKQAVDGFNRVDKKVQSVGASLKSMAGIFGITLGGAAILGFLKQSFEAFSEEEKIVKLLATTLGKSTKGLQEYASAMQKVTIYGDEEILMAQKMIADFTKNEDEIKQLTKVTLDFATAKQKDLVSASEIVSKSIYGETNMLGRYGVKIKEGLQGTEKFAAITTKLAFLFGGQAQAAAKTYSGRLEILKNKFGDVQEKIGAQLIPVVELLMTKFNNSVEALDKLLNIDLGKAGKLLDFLKELAYYLNVPARMGEGGQIQYTPEQIAQIRTAYSKSPTFPEKATPEQIALSMKLMREALLNEMTKTIDIINTELPQLSSIGKVAVLKEELLKLGVAFEVAGSDIQRAKINKRIEDITDELNIMADLGKPKTWATFRFEMRKMSDEFNNFEISINKANKELFSLQEKINRIIADRKKRGKVSILEKPFGEMKGMPMPKNKFGQELDPLRYMGAEKTIDDLKREWWGIEAVASGTADAIGQTWMEMWRSVFGEADNLVTKLFNNIMSRLASLATEKLALTIFEAILLFINPSASAVAMAIAARGASSRGQRVGKISGDNTYVIQIGEQKLVTLVGNVLPQAYSEKVRYREIRSSF